MEMIHDIETARRTVAEKARRGELHMAPDGPIVERFDPLLCAEALEFEIARSRQKNLPKISIHMDIDEAVEVARGWRKLALLG